eukprot:5406553-Pyramimonas_sp.AAC.1
MSSAHTAFTESKSATSVPRQVRRANPFDSDEKSVKIRQRSVTFSVILTESSRWRDTVRTMYNKAVY